MPTAPAAPVLFTTPTGDLRTFSMAAATGRAVRSATPPGGNGATSVIGRVGNASWAAPPGARTRTARTAAAIRLMASLLFRPGSVAHASPGHASAHHGGSAAR